MAIGTPSSVKENRIFFNATIVSVARSRARYTVPYAPENYKLIDQHGIKLYIETTTPVNAQNYGL